MNTTPFTKSATYYDLLYQKKNYEEETKKIDSIIRMRKVPSKKMLDLGCGTGEHAILFTNLGYSVTGVDLSTKMLSIAKNKTIELNTPINFKRGNIVSFTASQPFGVAVSLFHVLSYLLTNTDISTFFSSTYQNLQPGGLFIFDCWYGPGVLQNPPTNQTKTGFSNNYTYIRTKTPTHKPKQHIVRVMHNMTITFPHHTVRYKELHCLRYFFIKEIKQFLKRNNFKLLSWGDLNNNLTHPKQGDWNVLFVAQKPSTKKGTKKLSGR